MFDWLHEEFEKRKLKNPSYSLRAFSRDLGMSSGRLSEVLRGKRFLGPTTVTRVAVRLNYTPAEVKNLLDRLKVERESYKLFNYLSTKEKNVDNSEVLILSSDQSELELKKQEEALLDLLHKLKSSKNERNAAGKSSMTIQVKIYQSK